MTDGDCQELSKWDKYHMEHLLRRSPPDWLMVDVEILGANF